MTNIVRCDCTLEWCKRRRENQSRAGNAEKRLFSVPSLVSTNGRGPRIIERTQILKTLRPNGRDVSPNSTLVFLWWHLRPSAFEWRNVFSKKTKNKSSRWFVRSGVPLAFSALYEEPPPDNQNAIFEDDKWVEIPNDELADGMNPEQIEAKYREFKTREINRAWKILDEVANSSDSKVRNAVSFIKDYVEHIKAVKRDNFSAPSYSKKAGKEVSDEVGNRQGNGLLAEQSLEGQIEHNHTIDSQQSVASLPVAPTSTRRRQFRQTQPQVLPQHPQGPAQDSSSSSVSPQGMITGQQQSQQQVHQQEQEQVIRIPPPPPHILPSNPLHNDGQAYKRARQGEYF